MNSLVRAYRWAWSPSVSPYAARSSWPETMLTRTRPPLRWSRVAEAEAKFAGRQYPGRTAISGLNVVVRAASAVATVNVSGRLQPVPSSAPSQPWSSSDVAWWVSVSRLLCAAESSSSPRCPGRTWLGMYQSSSRSVSELRPRVGVGWLLATVAVIALLEPVADGDALL